jgi:hypothetical protein
LRVGWVFISWVEFSLLENDVLPDHAHGDIFFNFCRELSFLWVNLPFLVPLFFLVDEIENQGYGW